MEKRCVHFYINPRMGIFLFKIQDKLKRVEKYIN